MRTLYLVRHAKSSWADLGARDFERTLEERGHRDAPRMAELLRGMGVMPDFLVSSPAIRAKMTAEYFAKKLGILTQNIEFQQDIYESDLPTLLHLVRDLPDSAPVICLFGHNPTFTYFANQFSQNPIDNVPTCGMVKIECDTEGGWSEFGKAKTQVSGFWYPKML